MEERFGSSLKRLVLLGFAAVGIVSGQAVLDCQASVNPILVRGEGLTEQMGAISFFCTGGQPNQVISGNLSVYLSIPMTNRVDGSGNTDVLITVDTGSGPQPVGARAFYLSSTNLSFSGVQFTLSASGSAVITLSNVRGAAYTTGVNSQRQITATLSFNGGGLPSFSNNIFRLGTVLESLYSSNVSPLICAAAGTPTIGALSMQSAIGAGAEYATIRVTEGFNNAFSPRSDPNFYNADSGTRFVVRYSNIPAGVELFVPDAVVGTDGAAPTSAGDYGLQPSGGAYLPGQGQLLLLRVPGTDLSGGGFAAPFLTPPTVPEVFDSLAQVAVNSDGTAQVVYEVYDADPNAVESATIPTFIYVPPNAVTNFTVIGETVNLGAISDPTNLSTAPNNDVPRYVAVTPPTDCKIVDDCNASYFPKLAISGNYFDVSLTTQDTLKNQYVQITNAGGGNFYWTAAVTYLSGAAGNYQWLQPTPIGGLNQGTLTLNIIPGKLPAGVYSALVTIDAGPIAGKQLIQVVMRLAYQAPTPILINALNPADQIPGNLVPGSLAEIIGDRLEGNNVTVLFNTSPAQIVQSTSAQQLIVQVPYDVAGQTTALITVTIDGSTGDGILMPIVASAPGVYANAIINADNTRNTPTNGALVGSTISVYATGLPATGVYSGQIHDRTITGDALVYAGPAPLAIGIQQFQMIVPADLPSMTTNLNVCGGLTQDTVVCSPSVNVTLNNPATGSKQSQ